MFKLSQTINSAGQSFIIPNVNLPLNALEFDQFDSVICWVCTLGKKWR